MPSPVRNLKYVRNAEICRRIVAGWRPRSFSAYSPEKARYFVRAKVKEGSGGFSFNAAKPEYEDIIKAGMIDPAKVVRIAIDRSY